MSYVSFLKEHRPDGSAGQNGGANLLSRLLSSLRDTKGSLRETQAKLSEAQRSLNQMERGLAQLRVEQGGAVVGQGDEGNAQRGQPSQRQPPQVQTPQGQTPQGQAPQGQRQGGPPPICSQSNRCQRSEDVCVRAPRGNQYHCVRSCRGQCSCEDATGVNGGSVSVCRPPQTAAGQPNRSGGQ